MGSIIVNNVGKAYKQYPTRWSRLAEWLAPRTVRHSAKWVLQGVNFSVKPGEAVGIIGVNGAGKSTLLKIITGTTQPTTGNVQCHGRVAALLELGMGFHPDFTGRQNVYMAGQLLGYSIEEISSLMPDIEAFAEIGEYIEYPVRVYSSGMQVRLAFSVAVARRPDILVVDEALAVGDVYFQQKCYQRIQRFVEEGTTLLFVTHGMSTVLEVCNRAIYLQTGNVVFDGSPKEAVDLYQADMIVSMHQGEQKPVVGRKTDSSSSAEADKGSNESVMVSGAGSLRTDAVICTGVELLDEREVSTTTILSESLTTLRIRYYVRRNLCDPHVGFKIRTRTGTVIFESNTDCMRHKPGEVESECNLVVDFKFKVDLAPGDYTITVGLANDSIGEGSFKEYLSYLHEVFAFTVLPNPSGIMWAGIVNIHPTVSWDKTPQVPTDPPLSSG